MYDELSYTEGQKDIITSFFLLIEHVGEDEAIIALAMLYTERYGFDSSVDRYLKEHYNE